MKTIEEHLSKVDKYWDKDYIIRYLIRALAPSFQKDLDYFLLSNKEQLEKFYTGYRPLFPNVICTTLCEFYQDVFHEFGIETKIINANHGELEGRAPLYALIVKGTYFYYYINPLKDLYTHQLGISPNAYGFFSEHYNQILDEYPYIQFLSPDYIRFLDERLGFASNDALFKENINILKNPTKYRTLNGFNKKTPLDVVIMSKLKYISDNYINVGEVPGLLERNAAYKYFIRNTFTRPEKQHLQLGLNLDRKAIKIAVNVDDYSALFEEEKQNGIYRLIRKK